MGAKKNIPETFLFHPFANLKKIIESKGIKFPSKIAPPAKEKPLDEEELFISAMKEVREIKEFRKIPVHQKTVSPSLKNIASDHEALKALEEIVTGKRPVSLPDTQEYIEWINLNYKGVIIRKLREGQFSVQDCIDLHGLSIEDAEKEVELFLKDSLRNGYRCVKIIHGRGLRSPKGPVLKNALVKWLSVRFRKNIIAFVTARQCDGGLGAMYILLR